MKEASRLVMGGWVTKGPGSPSFEDGTFIEPEYLADALEPNETIRSLLEAVAVKTVFSAIFF